MIRFPAAPVSLGPWGQVEPKALPWPVVQHHVVGHVLGQRRRAEAPVRPWTWDDEAWSGAGVIDSRGADGALKTIEGLTAAGSRCAIQGIGDLSGWTDPERDERACLACPEPLATCCGQNLASTAEAYFRCQESALETISGASGTQIGRAELLGRLASVQTAEALEGLVVAGLRKGNEQTYLRIGTWEGMVIELYVGSGGRLRWRTAYRLPAHTLAERIRVLVSRQLPTLGADLRIPASW